MLPVKDALTIHLESIDGLEAVGMLDAVSAENARISMKLAYQTLKLRVAEERLQDELSRAARAYLRH